MPSGVDESLIRQQLELSQADRIRQLDHQVSEMWLLMEAGKRRGYSGLSMTASSARMNAQPSATSPCENSSILRLGPVTMKRT
jgi:hypothetical protein